MARKSLEDGQRFDYRVGSRGYILGGMMQDADPGSQPPNRPRMIINGRFKGGGIVSRPPYSYVDFLPNFQQMLGDGASPATVTDFDWSMKFMSEHHPTRQNNQLWVGRYDGNSSYLSIADQPFKTPEDIASYPSLVQKPPQVERFNGEIFVGDTGFLRRIYRVGLTLADLPTDDILYTFPGFRVYAMHEFAGRLFVFVADPDGVANAYVFSYDGSTVFAEVTLGTPGKDGASFEEFKGKLFLGIKGDTSLHIRDADGNWTFLTDASFLHAGFTNSMIAEPNLLKIFGDSNTSAYTEPGGTPTLTVGSPGLPSGWTRALVGARVGPYGFYGGTKVWPSDSNDTPVFQDTGTFQDNSAKMAQWHATSDVIPKGMAVFCNRVYYCIGFEDTAVGGSIVGYFRVPRQVEDPIGTFPTAGVGIGSSIELMKGDH